MLLQLWLINVLGACSVLVLQMGSGFWVYAPGGSSFVRFALLVGLDSRVCAAGGLGVWG